MSTYLDKTAGLTPAAVRIICHAATEPPHSGQYNTPQTHGTFLCRRCGIALFRAGSQFASGCGWPSFDVDIPNRVKNVLDPDGIRTEIRCARCEAHLGHVFEGERFTAANRRYCVNAASLDFVSSEAVDDTEEAILAGGCFWGVEYFLKRLPGVVKVESGYCGGEQIEPTYHEVCSGHTGHLEAVRVLFDNNKINYHDILKRFFEIHDPTQANGQGPDIGSQYQSAVFFYDDEQQRQAFTLINRLQERGYHVVTQVRPVKPFWTAEEYHQQYYDKHQRLPYCHKPVKRFDDA